MILEYHSSWMKILYRLTRKQVDSCICKLGLLNLNMSTNKFSRDEAAMVNAFIRLGQNERKLLRSQ